ncbi:helix-turn-helix domain-containing protein [Enterococcus rotai]|uniref:helix-turn-helix domain-containing protein n=1 Tax=Enterococcus rotai TaxID=118060 RepID=UPI0032B4B46F
MRAFLDEAYDRKLKVLSYINKQRKVVSIKNISENTKFSEKTVLQIIRQFEQEFHSSSDQFQISYVNKTIKGIITENLDVMSIAAKYLENSILYKIIYSIFLYEKVDVKKFCELEYISPSTFSRYRQRLASILKKFDLKLSRVNEVTGDELKIRNFFFSFFSNASNQWVFKPEEYREIENSICKKVKYWSSLNDVKKSRICLLIYISNRRSPINNCDNGILVELSKKSEFSYKEALADYFRSKKNRSQEQIWQEVSYIQLFMYKEELLTEKIQYDQYEAFFNKENFSFTESSNLLTEKIINIFFSGNNIKENSKLYFRIRQEIDKLHLILSTCYIDTNVFRYIYEPNISYYFDKAEKEVIEQIKQIVTELELSSIYWEWWKKLDLDKSVLVEHIYLAIYMLLNEIHQYTFPRVKVMIQTSKAFAETIMTNKVELVFTNRVQVVQNLADNPDVLITDIRLSGASGSTKVIYTNSLFDVHDFSKVVDEIEQEILKKYYHRTLTNSLGNGC